jgi:hypothetical protein
MKEPWLTITFMITALLPPIISGPGAAALFVAAIKSKRRWSLPLFWVALPALDIAMIVWVALSRGGLFGPDLLACALTPVIALVTMLALMLARKRVYRRLGEDKGRRRWYGVGVVAIPSIQMALMALFLLLGPYLCELGIGSCPDW